MSDANVDLVKRMFEAFAAGDIPGLLALQSEDTEWDHSGPAGVPLNRVWKGRDGVAEFFRLLAELQEPLSFEPRSTLGRVIGSSCWDASLAGPCHRKGVGVGSGHGLHHPERSGLALAGHLRHEQGGGGVQGVVLHALAIAAAAEDP
jgi:hypothetical protein